MSTPILQVRNLDVKFQTPEGVVQAVNNVSFTVEEGKTVGLVGESGSGKSQIFMAIMGLLASNGKAQGEVLFQNKNILNLPQKELNKIRGQKIAMIFQDPMTSLNPYLTVAQQMTEVLVIHQGMSTEDARKRSIEMLDAVRIPEASRRIDMHPHEFSGGMRQRVMIAMALLCQPDLLIADEPTTALDVTVQAQILQLMADLKKDFHTSIILITHDLGVVAGLCDDVMVMYAGQLAETGDVETIFYNPQHPYTWGLIQATPRLDEVTHDQKLRTIMGQPPNLMHLPVGCPFQDRCAYAFSPCRVQDPPLELFSRGHYKACHLEILPRAEDANDGTN